MLGERLQKLLGVTQFLRQLGYRIALQRRLRWQFMRLIQNPVMRHLRAITLNRCGFRQA